MRGRIARRNGGFSLVELIIAISLLGVIGGAVLLAASSTSTAMQSSSTLTDLHALSRRAIERITSELDRTNRDDVLPAAPAAEAPFHASQIDYQRTDYVADAVVLGNLSRIGFEYAADDPDDGIDNNGNGLVDEGVVVLTEDLGLASERRTTLCRNVSETLEREIAGNGADDNGNGLRDEGGLSFDFDGDCVTVRLTLERVAPKGLLLQSSVQRTKAFR